MTFIEIDGYKPKHLSFSTVDGYRTCGMRMKLQKVLQTEQRPGLAGIGGNAVHTATEWYDVDEGDDVAGNPNFDPKGAFEAAWNLEVAKRTEQSPSFKYPEDFIVTGRASAAYGGKRNVQWWMDNGPVMVQKWIDWRQNGWQIWETPEGTPAVETQLNIVLPGDIPVLMYLDRIMVTPAGQIVVVDIKTGREPDTPEQLGLYATGIEQIFGKMFRPDWGYWWSGDKGTHGSPQPLGMYTADYFAEVYSEAIRGINAECFLAKPANRCFNWCSSAHVCPANPDSLSRSK